MENTSGNTQTIWIADFTINEPLHEAASSISAAYTRMTINFPEDPSAKVWNEEALTWHRYYTNINKMIFSTHEEGELEIERIGKINRDVLEIEQNLITKSN